MSTKSTAASEIYDICIPGTLRDAFAYTSHVPLLRGQRVQVPFRKQYKTGFVVGAAIQHPPNLRPVESAIDELSLIPDAILDLIDWVARYYQAPRSEVLRLALPKRFREGEPWESISSSKQMEKVFLPTTSLKTAPTPTEEQIQAIRCIQENSSRGYCGFLLHGVTGSGKTEVYQQLIQPLLEQNKQILILVPEIGLTPQLALRLQERFSANIAVLHSKVSEKRRAQIWEACRTGICQILVGTRSAVFSPMPNLGLIILDEEHDSSFKQMEGVRYHARDTAILRAHQQGIPVLLGTATPSLESLLNVKLHKLQLLQLKKRANAALKPAISIEDLSREQPREGLGKATIAKIHQHLKQNHQVFVFMNRRGYAPVYWCDNCAKACHCKACSSYLTYHAKQERLLCHHCGFSQKLPTHCPQCKNQTLHPLGQGTQRLEKTLVNAFPDYPILRLDKDELGKKDALPKALADIHAGKYPIIVGTQLLAKGHHFPNLNLVVVVDVDQAFFSVDFRALEHTGQLLEQVAGRAGREGDAGEVHIQTRFPSHPKLLQLCEQGYFAFAETLLAEREQARLAPYEHIALLMARCRNSNKALHFCKQAAERIKALAGTEHLQIMGPVPAPMALKAHEYRWQLLLKSGDRVQLHRALSHWRHTLTPKDSSGVIWHLDIDPINLS